MSQPMIQFLGMSTQTYECAKAILPIIHQSRADLVIGDGASTTQTTIASGQPAHYGGQVIVQGCYDVKLSITYLGGDDCDSCTTDTITPTVIEVVAPKNSSFPLPNGFWSQIDYELVDTAGVATTLTGTQTETLRFYSAYTPSCPDCGVVVP